MARPLRIEFPGAVYLVASRSEGHEPIYRDDQDRSAQIETIARAMDRFDAEVLAYCQMDDRFHLVLHTRRANLSRLMRHVNGVYTQAFNRRHGLAGPLFRGRFKAIVVDREAHLLALCRSVERSPVAAGWVAQPDQWPWSSCRAHLGQAVTPPWLDSDGLHGYLLGRPVGTARDRRRATQRYATLLARAEHALPWESALRGQIFLGDADFMARMQALATAGRRAALKVPKAQRKSTWTLQDCLKRCADRAQALRMAYRDCGIPMSTLAKELQLSVSQVSRLIAAAERGGDGQ